MYMDDGYGGDNYDLQSIPNSYEQPVYANAVTNDIATLGAAGSNVMSSEWSGFFRDIVKTGITYAVKKDAFQTGVTQQAVQQRQNAAPYYLPGTQTGSSPGLTMNQILLFGGLFAAVMILKK